MNPENTPLDNFQKFAQQMLEETKKSIRDMFIAFRDTAFPKAKRDNLDYEAVCLIEKEFRTQEDTCVNLLTESFNVFYESNEKWLARFNWTLQAYNRMAVATMERFVIDLQGHTFTYYPDPLKTPDYIVEKLCHEGSKTHDAHLLKQTARVERLALVFDKVISKVLADRTEIEEGFEKAMSKVIDVDLPASHKRVEVIITQHYLQKVGDIHGEN